MALADTGLAAEAVGAKAAWSSVKDALPRPPRGAGIKVEDSGNGGSALVEFLAEKRLV